MEIIDADNGLVSKMKIKKKKERSGFTKFANNDLIWAKITPCMQNGKSAIVSDLVNGVGCGSTEFFILREKTDAILIDYVLFILRDKRILQTAENYFGGSAGQQRVPKTFLERLKIPLPPKKIQQNIVDIMDNAYLAKREKEQEAQRLLDSIDDYLLGELGIVMPAEEENTLENRMNYVHSSEVIGGRFDPNYYSGQEVFLDAIGKSFYEITKFSQLMMDLNNGVEIRDYSEIGYRYLRVTDMSNKGITNHSPRYVNVVEIPAKVKLSKQDLLISRSGSLGLVNIVSNEILDAILSSHIFKVTIFHDVNVEYLQEFLRSTLGQFQFFKKNNGGIIPEISQMALKSILIVIPTHTKQEEIVTHIKSIRERAKQLEEDAKRILSDAKKKVEAILMGEEL